MVELCTLAVSLADLPARLGAIAYFIISPMLLTIAIGFILQRKVGLNTTTLARLNFYFTIPGTVYYSVVHSQLALGEVGTIVAFSTLLMAMLAGLSVLAALARRVPRDQINALIATTIFYNSGNYGLPLQAWAFRDVSAQRGQPYADLAVGYQTVVMLIQNVSNFTVGVLLAASGKRDRHWKGNLLHIAKFPPLYALAAALATVQLRDLLGPERSGVLAAGLRPFWDVVTLLRNAFVPIALLTLGAQLAQVRRDGMKYPVTLSVALRLIAAPVIGFGLVWLLGLQGLMAQVMLISTASPTAVNAMLVCLEFDNHPDYVARAVFYSSIFSPVVGAVVIFLAQGDFWVRFAL